jgi:hypothetical protein
MPFLPGDILLDKYRIEALIGQGSFGEVYRVTHIGLNVPRAVKILRKDAPGVGSTEFGDYRKRFQFEAQLGARLNTPTPHPNLLQVFDYAEKGDILVLEMEYASSGSLAERMEKLRTSGEAMPLNAVIQMGIEVAQGLAAIHAVDIVHRDLKPSNILFDQHGHAKVADLGLAQAHGSDSLRSRVSSPPPHPGTPAYMSPEQRDTRDYLPPASDVYALGLVLFEALTGRVYRSQRPGTRPVSLRAEIPAWLDEVLVRMLTEDPNLRPWDGQEAASLLQEGLGAGKARSQAELEAEKRSIEEQERRAAEEQVRQEAEIRANQVAREQARQMTTATQVHRKVEQQPSQGYSSGINWKIWGVVLGVVIVITICLLAGGGGLLAKILAAGGAATQTEPGVVIPTQGMVQETAPARQSQPSEISQPTFTLRPTYTSQPTYTMPPTFTPRPTFTSPPVIPQSMSGNWTFTLHVSSVVPGDGVTGVCPDTEMVTYYFNVNQDAGGNLSGAYSMQSFQNLGTDQYPFSGKLTGSQFTITSSITSGDCNGNINLWQGSLSGSQLTGSKSITRKGSGYCCSYAGLFEGLRSP